MDAKYLLALCAALTAAPAIADVTVLTVMESDGKPHSALYVAGGKVRAETQHGDRAYVLWQTGGNAMTIVDPSNRTYMVFDKAQVAEQMKAVNAQMEQMQQQLASLPPEMRAMMQKNMPGAGKPIIERKVTKTGKSMTKAGHGCKVVDLAITGVPFAPDMGEELCVVDPTKLGIPAADLKTLEAMAQFAIEMTRDLGQVVGGTPDIMSIGGYPVWSKEKRSGEASVLKSVTTGAVDGALFSVPAGYTQQQMPSMDGAGKKKRKKRG